MVPLVLYVGLVEESEWLGSTIVFSDLDSMLNIALSDVDESTPIAFVGQGSGAQLALRYALNNPTRPIQLIATHSEGFAVPRLVPQMVSELKENSAPDVGERWLPAFVYHDWLAWLHNPFSDAIEKETHLVPKFKHADLTPHLQEQTVWVGLHQACLTVSRHLESKLSSCSFETQWTCATEFTALVQQVLD